MIRTKLSILTFCIVFINVTSFAQTDTTIVALKSVDSTIVQDVRYATKNNFTGKVLYPTAKVYLRKAAAEKLAAANKYLIKNHNLRIKIYDGYRPLSVQKIMWKIMPDDRYVANPSKGSRHNRGAAVDVTLIDSSEKELDMGTPYDDFTETAHYDFPDLPNEVKQNRKLLRDVMMRFGFTPINTEWWHFDLRGWSRFSILDLQIH